MVEENAKILKVEGDVVWVQAIQQSACGSCQAQKGCGHSLLAKTGQRQIDLPVARNGLDVSVHDQVVIGVPEQAILKSSMLMYGVPLGAMLAVAILASLMGLSEAMVILASFVSLAGGFFWVSRHAKGMNIEAWHPKLVSKVQASQSEIPMCEIH